MDRPLPPKIAQYAALKGLHNPRYGGGYGTDNEHYVSGCFCGNPGHDWGKGEPDRFVMRPDGTGEYGDARWWCRYCNQSGWIDHDLDGEGVGTPSPQAIREMQERREKLEREYQQRKQEKLKWLRNADFWIKAHEEMRPEHYKIWKAEHHISESMVRLHKLGHRDANERYAEALTIPYFREGTGTEDLQTLQLRLCDASSGGKYRFIADLGQHLFFPMPIDCDIEDRVLLVTEGAKKGMVVQQLVWSGESPLTYQGHDVTIVAVPAKKIAQEMMGELGQAARILWLLDPDAYTPKKINNVLYPPDIEDLVIGTSWKNSRIIRPTGKIDDMIAKHGLARSTLQAMVNQAEPYMRQYQK